MQLTLNKLIPIPLQDKASVGQSSIWRKSVSFTGGNKVFIQAPSGTGKTTLVHILYGTRKDYEGSVQWGNEVLEGINTEKLAKLRATDISVIFQDMRLLPELTAWENLQIKQALTHTVTDDTLTNWMLRLGIEDKKNALASTLSYGEQQRLAIIRALVQPFQWILMDEPFSHLDHNNIHKAIGLITEVVEQRKAGLLLADLDENNYFPYTQTVML